MRGAGEMTQGDLFNTASRLPYGGDPPAQKHSKTSVTAAKTIKKHIGPLHQKILDFLTRNPMGACDEKMGMLLGMGLNTLRPRRRELQLIGRVKDSDRTELTASGRTATIWVLA